MNGGNGVVGGSDSGIGVEAVTTTGRGLWAVASAGGVAASLFAKDAGSTALAVRGVTSFSRSGTGGQLIHHLSHPGRVDQRNDRLVHPELAAPGTP
jgi:hypothetical protein